MFNVRPLFYHECLVRTIKSPKYFPHTYFTQPCCCKSPLWVSILSNNLSTGWTDDLWFPCRPRSHFTSRRIPLIFVCVSWVTSLSSHHSPSLSFESAVSPLSFIKSSLTTKSLTMAGLCVSNRDGAKSAISPRAVSVVSKRGQSWLKELTRFCDKIEL